MCFETASSDISNGAASSATERSSCVSSCRIARRTGCESAWNTASSRFDRDSTIWLSVYQTPNQRSTIWLTVGINYATAIVGGDIAYVNNGFAVQAEASLSQSVRARGDKTAAGTDSFRTRATIGTHLGLFLGRHVSLGADVQYLRWLSVDEMTDARIPLDDDDMATLTASIGVRVHVHVGNASVHPGLSYTRGFDGLALHGPMDITKQTNAIGITVPVLF